MFLYITYCMLKHNDHTKLRLITSSNLEANEQLLIFGARAGEGVPGSNIIFKFLDSFPSHEMYTKQLI